jgi:hypothetical protein
VAHPLVLGLFPSPVEAADAARALHTLGIDGLAISVVARSHREEGMLARAMDASPGVELEDLRSAARVAELGAVVIAAAAVVMPGVGPVVAAGPLAAEMGEAAGHLAGGLSTILRRAGVDPARAADWEEQVNRGRILLGVHVTQQRAAEVEEELRRAGALEASLATSDGEPP